MPPKKQISDKLKSKPLIITETLLTTGGGIKDDNDDSDANSLIEDDDIIDEYDDIIDDDDDEDIINVVDVIDATIDDDATNDLGDVIADNVDIDAFIEDEVIEDESFIEDDDKFYSEILSVPVYTSKYLTNYEKVRALSVRACMITNGAPSTLNIDTKMMRPIDIAIQELHDKKMPLIIQRKLPHGTTENISINSLIDINITLYI